MSRIFICANTMTGITGRIQLSSALLLYYSLSSLLYLFLIVPCRCQNNVSISLDPIFIKTEKTVFFPQISEPKKSTCTEILNAPPGVGPIALVIKDEPSEAIKDMYHLNGGIGYIHVEDTNTTDRCYKITVELVLIDGQTKLPRGENHTAEYEKVNRSSFILGEPSSYVLHASVTKPYFLATPISIEIEEFMLEIGKAGVAPGDLCPLYSIWPSQSVYVAAAAMTIEAGVRDFDYPIISFLYYAETVDSLEFTDLLMQNIRRRINCNVRMLNLFKTMRLLEQGGSDLYGKTRFIRSNLGGGPGEEEANYVVIYMDLPMDKKLFLLESMDNPASALSTFEVTWFIVDMTFAYTKLPDPSVPFIKHYITLRQHGQSTSMRFLTPNIDVIPVVNDTLRIGMSHEGILETGLKNGLALSKMLLSKKLQGKKWNIDDFFSSCADRSSIDERKNNLEPAGFPKETQLVLKSKALLTGQKMFGGCADTVCGFEGLFGPIRNPQVISACLKMAETDEVTYVGSDKYFLCRNPGQSDYKIVYDQEYAAVVPDSPFVIKNIDGTYDGLAVEIYKKIVEELAKDKILLNLEFLEVTSYGTKKSSGNWTGIFGKLSEKIERDYSGNFKKGQKPVVMGIGQISVTEERLWDSRFVFTPPFAYTYYSFMIRMTSVYDAYLSFTRPFSLGVWMMVLTVLFFSGLYLFTMQKWNPFKESPPDGPTLKRAQESFWHSFMILTQTGAPFGAYLYPSRVFSVFYWLFALVVCACYTGNLTSFLTKTDLTLDWYPGDPTYTYGMVTNTSLSKHFQDSSIIGKEWRRVVAGAELVPNYTEGMKRVQKEKFVLLGTSLVLQDFIYREKQCKYYVWHGAGMAHRMYHSKVEPLAFPIRKGWKYTKQIRRTMQQLQEQGEIQKIYRKWIKHTHCEMQPKDDQGLAFENFVGLYILISVAVVVSYILLAIKLAHLKFRAQASKEETEDEVTDRLADPEGIELKEENV